eukprot:snap_masked-scaffold_10-processed-gene-7.27-mRNA-1 protein AED:0.29 eAED:0.29 QI:0/-1/0/1/-1/1/1/0/354
MKELYGEFLETIPSLEGKTIAITGTTSGTGFYTAICAVRKNAKKLLLLNRKSERADECVRKLEEEKEKCSTMTDIQLIECDLMSFDSVKNAAERIQELCTEGLDVLINNAGIMALPDKRTVDGFDIQMQVNHLSHFLLTHLLLPTLKRAADQGKDVRIVQHSSGARNQGGKIEAKYFKTSPEKGLGGHGIISCFLRYHQTKLANTNFALMLHKKLQETSLKAKIKSVVAEPGVSDTNLFDSVKAKHQKEGTYGWGTVFYMKLVDLVNSLGVLKFQSPADGAMPIIKVSFGEDVDGGDFFVPEHKTKGIPVKVITKGEKVLIGKELKSMSNKNQEIVWNTSEESLGIKFFSTLKN